MPNGKKRRHILKPRRLIFLIVLLASNTFAWFIYATKINTDVSVHVRAWNVVFESGQNEISNDVNLTVDSIYPGMADYEYEITAYNHSEVSASMSYEILSARILDDEYYTAGEKSRLGLTITGDEPTSQELEDMLENDYPFSITFATSSNTIAQTNGSETYTLSVVWPYESNDDATDTLWGSNAYTYKESNPSSPSIALKVRITIIQNPD